jgi:hypothetical protein
MRVFLGIILSLAFIGGGIVPVLAGFSMLSRGITGDDVLAAFLMGAMAILIGAGIFWAVMRARKKARDLDAGVLSGTVTGMWLGAGDDGAGGYDGDDFGE